MSDTANEYKNDAENNLEMNFNGMSIESELQIIRNLLRYQIKQNRIIEEKNLELSNKNSFLDSKCSELFARSQLQSKELSKVTKNFVTDEEALETDMLKAKINSSVLKSIVTPLEQEVAYLKRRVSEAEACLNVSSFTPVTVYPEVPIETLSSTSEDSLYENAGEIKNNEDLKMVVKHEKNKDWASELQARELYIITQTKKINELEMANDAVIKENEELEKMLEKERTELEDIKESWKRANEQFILQSNHFRGEIQHLKQEIVLEKPPSSLKEKKMSEDYNSYSKSFQNLPSGNSILLQAELSRLREELLLENNKNKDFSSTLDVFMGGITDKLQKCENDFVQLESLFSSVQEEVFAKIEN